MLKLKTTWKHVELGVELLQEKIENSGKEFTYVMAITKGGLIPAYYVAKKLKIPYIGTICLQSYEGEERKAVIVHEAPFYKKVECGEETYKSIIIVDDIVDSGETMKKAQELFPGASSASIYRRKDTNPDFSAFISDKWVVFPWEK